MRVGRLNNRALAGLAELPAVDRQAKRVASEIERTAASLAPFLTGALRRSLTVVKGRGSARYRVGWDESIAPYGFYVELGTEDTPAQPHLRPAAKRVKRR